MLAEGRVVHRDSGWDLYADRATGRAWWWWRSRGSAATAHLEYHHLKPWIAGGMASVENIALRCHAHNQYEAEVFFARGA